MQSNSVKISTLDLVTTLLNDKGFETSESGESTTSMTIAMIMENRELLMILTALVAVLIGCVVVLVWRRSSTKKFMGLPVVVSKRVQEEERWCS
ncbi:putative NADPH--hemoprotein reductase [Helianthus anomalus]